MKKSRNPLILLAFASTVICGLGFATKSSSSEEVSAYFTPTEHYQNYDADTYYDSISSTLDGTNLLNALRSLNSSRRKKTMGYKTGGTSASDSDFIYTDYDTSDPSTLHTDENGQIYGTVISSFYSYTPCTEFNKEHVWPNTHGGNKVEADIHMARPTIQAENSNRGHSYYVENMAHSTNGWDPYYAFHVNPGKTGDLGEQCINSRGESARIIFYCMVASNQLVLEAGHSDSSKTSNNKMGDLNDILKWHLQINVTDREKNRNEGAEYLQGNRNPFIDHRSYACKIWGNTNSTTKSLCDQYNGWTDGDEPTPEKTLVSIGISGTPSKTTYTAGEKFDTAGLIVTAHYSDESSSNVTSNATISVSPATLAVGDTSVTVTANYQGKSASKTITGLTVKAAEVPVSSVKINNATKDYYTGENCTLDVTVLPNNATDKSLTYSSSKPSVASVDSIGKVTFNATGSATITAKATNGVSGTITFNVTKAPILVESVLASLPSASYYVDDTDTIQYKVLPENADNKSVNFSSNNTSVATVNSKGEVSFLKAGNVTFTVSSKENSSIEDTISVVVSNRPTVEIPVESIEFDSCPTNVKVDDKVQLFANVLPEDATNKKLSYSSSNNEIATVNSTGEVSFKEAGSVIITATAHNGVTASISFTVSDKYVPVTGINVSMPKTTFKVGEKSTIEYEVLPEDATNKEVYFDSRNESIAKVDRETGYVEFLKAGEVILDVNSVEDEQIYGCIKVTVVDRPEPVEIVVTNNPNKTVYKVNEAFDSTGLAVEAHYVDGTSEDITDDVELIVPHMGETGTKTILVSYKESFLTSFSIVITNETISDLNVVKYPLKTHYFASEEFNPLGLVVEAKIGDETEDVSDLVTFDYDFSLFSQVTIKFNDLTKDIFVTIEKGEITDEHKAADFAYVVEDKIQNTDPEEITLNDWEVFEYYYNSLDDGAKEVLQNTITNYSSDTVSAAEELSETLKKCVTRYDEIYLLHKDEGFNDFMKRSPKAPDPLPVPTPDPGKKENKFLIYVGIAAGVVVLIGLIIIIAVVASKKGKRKHV